MFIQTETTPNPATLKFLPGQEVVASGSYDFRTLDEAAVSPLAHRLFGISGVVGVFLGQDFISVTKQDGEWQHMKPVVLGVIMEHYLAGVPVIAESEVPAAGEEFFEASDTEIVDTIKELLETRVRPAVAQDGGDIVFRGFRDGIVYLAMQGACAGCPSSTATLQYGIQNLLKHFVPEVEEVRPY